MPWSSNWDSSEGKYKIPSIAWNELYNAVNERHYEASGTKFLYANPLSSGDLLYSTNFRFFDIGLWNMVETYYIDHTQASSGSFEGHSSIPLWTKENILAEIGEDEIEYPKDQQICASWIYQRYKILNLLRWSLSGQMYSEIGGSFGISLPSFSIAFQTYLDAYYRTASGTSFSDLNTNWASAPVQQGLIGGGFNSLPLERYTSSNDTQTSYSHRNQWVSFDVTRNYDVEIDSYVFLGDTLFTPPDLDARYIAGVYLREGSLSLGSSSETIQWGEDNAGPQDTSEETWLHDGSPRTRWVNGYNFRIRGYPFIIKHNFEYKDW